MASGKGQRNSLAKEMSNVLHEDVGCHLHPSCLTCPEVPPLSMCVFDFPGYEKGWRQYKEIKRYMLVDGLTISEISKRMSLRRQYIEEILQKVEKLVTV